MSACVQVSNNYEISARYRTDIFVFLRLRERRSGQVYHTFRVLPHHRYLAMRRAPLFYSTRSILARARRLPHSAREISGRVSLARSLLLVLVTCTFLERAYPYFYRGDTARRVYRGRGRHARCTPTTWFYRRFGKGASHLTRGKLRSILRALRRTAIESLGNRCNIHSERSRVRAPTLSRFPASHVVDTTASSTIRRSFSSFRTIVRLSMSDHQCRCPPREMWIDSDVDFHTFPKE